MPSASDPSGEGARPPALTLADKIDRCFQTMHPKDRGPWTYLEVAAGVKALGVTVSASYLWQLRRAKKDNPTVKQIEALAGFFHVPMSYFFGTDVEVETVDAQMSVVRAMRSPQIRDLTLRASSLTPAGLRAIANIVEDIRAVQGMSTRDDRRPVPSQPEPSAPAATRRSGPPAVRPERSRVEPAPRSTPTRRRTTAATKPRTAPTPGAAQDPPPHRGSRSPGS